MFDTLTMFFSNKIETFVTDVIAGPDNASDSEESSDWDN